MSKYGLRSIIITKIYILFNLRSGRLFPVACVSVHVCRLIRFQVILPGEVPGGMRIVIEQKNVCGVVNHPVHYQTSEETPHPEKIKNINTD